MVERRTKDEDDYGKDLRGPLSEFAEIVVIDKGVQGTLTLDEGLSSASEKLRIRTWLGV